MIKEISVTELKQQISNNEVELIDVREEYELSICSIQNSINIKMNSIPKSLHKLNKKINYAVICHTGVRSLYVCNFLQKKNYRVVNIKGGIDEWAVQIDTNMKRY